MWRATLVCLPVVALPALHGQPPKITDAKTPTSLILPLAPTAKKHDLAKFTVQQRTIYLGAQRGMDWLVRANKPDGRFVYGFHPALRLPMEGDTYVGQAGAAFALARAAKYFG